MIALAIGATVIAALFILTVIGLLLGHDLGEALGISLAIITFIAVLIGALFVLVWIWQVALA